MSLQPTLLRLLGNMCDARLWQRGLGASLFILSSDQAFLLRSEGQLAVAKHG